MEFETGRCKKFLSSPKNLDRLWDTHTHIFLDCITEAHSTEVTEAGASK